MFKKIILRRIKEERAIMEKDKEKLKSNDIKLMLSTATLLLLLIFYGAIMTLQYKAVVHEATLVGCDLACSRHYGNINYFSSGYYPVADGGIECICYDVRVVPEKTYNLNTPFK
jgi:hypothetical protein